MLFHFLLWITHEYLWENHMIVLWVLPSLSVLIFCPQRFHIWRCLHICELFDKRVVILSSAMTGLHDDDEPAIKKKKSRSILIHKSKFNICLLIHNHRLNPPFSDWPKENWNSVPISPNTFMFVYQGLDSQTYIKRYLKEKEKVVSWDRWPLKKGSIHMKFSMTWQEKGNLLIQVTA